MNDTLVDIPAVGELPASTACVPSATIAGEAKEVEFSPLIIHSASIRLFAKALSAIQAEMRPIVRKGKVTYKDDKGREIPKYTYAELADMIATATPINYKHGMCFTQVISEHPDGRTILITYLIHESGEWFRSWLPVKGQVVLNSYGKASSSEAQALKSVITQQRRTLLGAALGMAEEDDDGEADREAEERASTSKKLAKVTPPLKDEGSTTEEKKIEELRLQFQQKCKEKGISAITLWEYLVKVHQYDKTSTHIERALKNFSNLEELFRGYTSLNAEGQAQ